MEMTHGPERLERKETRTGKGDGQSICRRMQPPSDRFSQEHAASRFAGPSGDVSHGWSTLFQWLIYRTALDPSIGRPARRAVLEVALIT